MTRTDRPSGPPRRRRGGFTLVELAAATALSVVLLTVVLSVVRSINRPAPVVADDAQSLADQLRWDVANAVVMRADASGLTLAGYGALDPATADVTHAGPVVVTYAVRRAGDHTWLTRDQTDLQPDGASSTELVAGDVAGLTVDAPPTPADVSAATRPADENPTPIMFQRLAGVRPVPPRVRLTVRFADRPPVVVEALR